MRPDPYDDGLALVLDLPRPATDADVAALDRAHDEWLASYEESHPPQYRNTGTSGEPGDRRLSMWADRISAPEAYARLEAIGSTLAGDLGAATRPPRIVIWRIEGAAAGSDADLDARLGTGAVAVRPGGDLVAELEARGMLPTPPGLRPALWLAGIVAILRFLARRLEAPLSEWAPSAITIAGVLVLAIAGRRWVRRTEHLLAAIAIAASVARVVAVWLAPDHPARAALGLVDTLTFVVWAIAWSRRGRRRS